MTPKAAQAWQRRRAMLSPNPPPAAFRNCARRPRDTALASTLPDLQPRQETHTLQDPVRNLRQHVGAHLTRIERERGRDGGEGLEQKTQPGKQDENEREPQTERRWEMAILGPHAQSSEVVAEITRAQSSRPSLRSCTESFSASRPPAQKDSTFADRICFKAASA